MTWGALVTRHGIESRVAQVYGDGWHVSCVAHVWDDKAAQLSGGIARLIPRPGELWSVNTIHHGNKLGPGYFLNNSEYSGQEKSICHKGTARGWAGTLRRTHTGAPRYLHFSQWVWLHLTLSLLWPDTSPATRHQVKVTSLAQDSGTTDRLDVSRNGPSNIALSVDLLSTHFRFVFQAVIFIDVLNNKLDAYGHIRIHLRNTSNLKKQKLKPHPCFKIRYFTD